MKKSVYVPDDLWEAATRADPDLNPSQVLQEALNDRYRTPLARPAYTALPPELVQRRDAAKQRGMEQLAGAYQIGYRFGLGFVSALHRAAWTLLSSVGYALDAFQNLADDYELAVDDE
jgi:hypothetical protein